MLLALRDGRSLDELADVMQFVPERRVSLTYLLDILCSEGVVERQQTADGRTFFRTSSVLGGVSTLDRTT